MKGLSYLLTSILIASAWMALPSLAQSVYEPYTFTTLAGRNPANPDGTGSGAQFHNLQGVAVDSAGNVYAADSAAHTIRKVTPAGVVTTLAGRVRTYGSADGTGGEARFSSPSAVAVDSAGNVYVADMGNHTVRKVTPTGVVTTLAGLARSKGETDGTGSAARFHLGSGSGVAVDGAGNVYVADTINGTIRKVTPAGVVTTMARRVGSHGTVVDGTVNSARLHVPFGVAVDSAGNVYVADRNMIRKVTPAGDVTTLAGQEETSGSADGTGSRARFRRPMGVAVDSVVNVYVADTENHTVRKVTPAGAVTTLAGLAGSPGSADGTGIVARFRTLGGVAVDSAGNVYVADTENSTIRKVTPAGVVTTLAGLARSMGETDGTGSGARFFWPTGVAVDSAGNVYVSDSGCIHGSNSAIRKVTPEGVVTTLAGVVDALGSADGTGSEARFRLPTGVAVDSAGNVYVADLGNGTIRKMTSTGVVTTLAGLAGSPGSADGTGVTPGLESLGMVVSAAWRWTARDFFMWRTGRTTRSGKGSPALIILNSRFDGPIFGINLTGQMGRRVTLEASTDLVSWQFLGVAGFSNTTQLTMTDPDASRFQVRFYRVSYQLVLLEE